MDVFLTAGRREVEDNSLTVRPEKELPEESLKDRGEIAENVSEEMPNEVVKKGRMEKREREAA